MAILHAETLMPTIAKRLLCFVSQAKTPEQLKALLTVWMDFVLHSGSYGLLG